MPWVSLPVVGACVLLAAGPALAQSAPPAETSATQAPNPNEARAHHERRLYFSMWTTHLKHEPIVLDNNWVIGLSARGFFGGTFLNSFGRRAFTGGIQRTIVSADRRSISASFGYRLGFVTGYDGRFMRIARKTPVLPFAQPFFLIDVRRVGFEVSYTFVVVSAAVSYRF